jgi:hypothetical protein
MYNHRPLAGEEYAVEMGTGRLTLDFSNRMIHIIGSPKNWMPKLPVWNDKIINSMELFYTVK